MTGEMHRSEVTPQAFPIHFAIARELGGSVEPFDVYQGPYVVIGRDVRVGSGVYALAPRGLGVVRLWLCSDDGCEGYIYNEASKRKSEPFPLYMGALTDELAVEVARETLEPSTEMG